MIVTYEQLKKARACDPALEMFFDAVGLQTADVEWNPAAQGLMLADPAWRRWFGWAVQNSIIPMWSMSKADLSGANLSGAKSNEYTTWPEGYKNE